MDIFPIWNIIPILRMIMSIMFNLRLYFFDLAVLNLINIFNYISEYII
jgi:hypothetical protein